MHVTLQAHPDFPSRCVDAIVATAERLSADRLRLHYRVMGRIGGIVLPSPAPSVRTDELWQSTCFEAFLSPGRGGAGYREFNFAPSGAWAAYAFAGYRAGMREEPLAAGPTIFVTRGDQVLEVEVLLRIDPPDEPCRLTLTAIVEERGAGRSFWAAGHPEGEPDFHHPSCFVERLPPAPRP
jgi:hypothetical protein